jgi:hypothetical protein
MKKIIVTLLSLGCIALFTNTSYAISAPKVSTPKVSVPKVSTPKVSTPRVSTPKTPTPKVSTPKVSTPKVSTPKVQNSQRPTSQNSTKYTLSRPSSTNDIKSSSSLVENTLHFRKYGYNTLLNENNKLSQSDISNSHNSSVIKSNAISGVTSNAYQNSSFYNTTSNDILRTVLLVELLSQSSRAFRNSSIQSKNEESTTSSEETSSQNHTNHASETSTTNEDSNESLLHNIVVGFFSFLCIGSIAGCLLECFDKASKNELY